MLNFSCLGYQIKLKWSLESFHFPSATLTSLTTTTVSTQSKLTIQPNWTHHGKNLICQLWDDDEKGPLSYETVQLDVKRESPPSSYGENEGPVPFSPAPQ